MPPLTYACIESSLADQPGQSRSLGFGGDCRQPELAHARLPDLSADRAQRSRPSGTSSSTVMRSADNARATHGVLSVRAAPWLRHGDNDRGAAPPALAPDAGGHGRLKSAQRAGGLFDQPAINLEEACATSTICQRGRISRGRQHRSLAASMRPIVHVGANQFHRRTGGPPGASAQRMRATCRAKLGPEGSCGRKSNAWTDPRT